MTCTTVWRPASSHTPEAIGHDLHGWLTESGSLTERLARHWPDLQVQVTQEGLSAPHAHEAARLAMGTDTPAWVRCVQLVGGGAVRLRARTVVPHWCDGHAWAAVATLGCRPLGSLLFGRVEVRRSDPEWACALDAQGRPEWSRRCVHTRHGMPLLLTETFVAVTEAA